MAKAKKKTAKKSTATKKSSTKKKATKRRPKVTKSLSQRDAETFGKRHKITPRQAAAWAKGKRELWKKVVG